MSLSAGGRLGPYEILSPLGAGGMGEVWKARDTRLARIVAVKVLPERVSLDPEALARFEREARSASALNHPNIVTVYEVGKADGLSYIAMEFVDGSTLREIAQGPVPLRRVLALAAQISDGLAKAHGAGIVHRDLKPENVMVSRDGFAKILDFGLAKLEAVEPEGTSLLPTQPARTREGTVLGTVGYMSPEQAAGREVDFRSDQFSFGSVLYELLTAQRAFERASAVETLAAIIREEPEPLEKVNRQVPPPLAWLVERCLAKDPEARYASTRDLARDLATFRDRLSQAPAAAPHAASGAPAPRLRRWAIAGAVLLVVVAGAFFVGRRRPANPPFFQRMTFRRGTIWSARFTPDGETVVYGGAWNGKPFRLFSARVGSRESRAFDLPDTDILAISSSGQMALSLGRHFFHTFDARGTLAQAPLAGGAPRPLLENVEWADWHPQRNDLAVVRFVGGKDRLEYPIGKVLYETAGWIGHPRFSPRGDRIAFLDHTEPFGPAGVVAVLDLDGRRRTLSEGWGIVQGLAWSPDGEEVWFTASRTGGARELWAVSMSRTSRLVAAVPGVLTLHDISSSGRVLLTREEDRLGIVGLPPASAGERELAWFDQSTVRDISADGKKLLFFEASATSDPNYETYLGQLDEAPPIRLGRGEPLQFSPDERWALSVLTDPLPSQLVMVPTGTGEARTLTHDGLQHPWANWMPDGKRILFSGVAPGRGTRLYLQSIGEGSPRAITGEGVSFSWHAVSPDGLRVAARGPDQGIAIYPIEGSAAPRPVPGLRADDEPIRWSGDGRALYAFRRGELPAHFVRIDPDSGERTAWKTIAPADPAGMTGIVRIRITPDGSSYAYSYYLVLSELYLVEGMK